MSVARRHHNSTLLPDGTVLVTGGTCGPGHNNPARADAVRGAVGSRHRDLDHAGERARVPRLYHSAALLLPDGRVVVTGGERSAADVDPSRDLLAAVSVQGPAPGHGRRAGAARRTASASRCRRAEAAGIGKVTLIRLSSVTHAFNMDQRLNVLSFTRGRGRRWTSRRRPTPTWRRRASTCCSWSMPAACRRSAASSSSAADARCRAVRLRRAARAK